MEYVVPRGSLKCLEWVPASFWISLFFFFNIGFRSSQRKGIRTRSLSTSPNPLSREPSRHFSDQGTQLSSPPSQPRGSKRLLFICTFKSRLPPVTRSSQAPGWCKKSPACNPSPIEQPFWQNQSKKGRREQGSPGVRVESGRGAGQ